MALPRYLSCLVLLVWMRQSKCLIQLEVPRGGCNYVVDCGRGNNNLRPGSLINITWGYECYHNDGYKVDLIIPQEPSIPDGEENVTETNSVLSLTLVPKSPNVPWANINNDPQYQLVTIPDEEACRGTKMCYLRMYTREQDPEDSNDFEPKKCTDIVNERCNGRGDWLSRENKCRCNSKFGGDACQEWRSCSSRKDCKGRGNCYNNKCYCEVGWFGDNCQRKSKFQLKSFSKTDYVRTDLATLTARWGPTMYWSLENNMLEVVLEAFTTSWVALGWRSAEGSQSCPTFGETDDNENLNDDGFLHPMACADMVVGVARGDKGYIGDYFSLDRNTPQRDEFWGGKDDLESGLIYESRGKTYMMFRKRVLTGDQADQPFGGKMQIIWAYGGENREKDFKYHGDSINQRGVVDLYFSETRKIEFYQGK